VVDRVVDVDPGFFEQYQEPPLKNTTGSSTLGKEVLTAYPIFLPLCDPENGASSHHRHSSPSTEPLISCPHLHTLHIRTTVDLCHFFSTFTAPALRNVRYAPIPRRGLGNGNLGAVERSGLANVVSMAEDLTGLAYGVITVENFPWNIGWETLEMFELVVSEDIIMQEGVEELLDEIAGEEGVSVRVVVEGDEDG
jgi:hypothetical protein